MSIDELLNLLALITLVELMVTIGLGVKFADVARVARDGHVVVRAVLANYICVPAAAVALLLLFQPHPLVAAGFLIAAVCPGAPYGPPFTALARGNAVLSVGLMVLLASSSALAAPLLLQVLFPLIAGDQEVYVDVARLVGTLLLAQLAPLCVGLAIRQYRPALADRLSEAAMSPAESADFIARLAKAGR